MLKGKGGLFCKTKELKIFIDSKYPINGTTDNSLLMGFSLNTWRSEKLGGLIKKRLGKDWGGESKEI